MQSMIRAGTLEDPAERWELERPASENFPRYQGINEIFPRTPRREEDVPRDARDSLREACRTTTLHQVFLVPPAVRSTGTPEQVAVSPASVLALGTSAVGLWTEKPHPGIKVLIPLDRLAAIEDVTVLLYSRLRFISYDEKLTIRYNTLARYGLRPALVELRERLTRAPQQLPRVTAPSPHLPLKWKRLLRGANVRFREDAPLVHRFSMEAAAGADEVRRGQLLVLTPHELIYLCDPREASHNYGEDSFIIPRSRITRVKVRERYLEIAANGARVCLDMAPALLQAAAEWFPETS